MEEEVEEAVVTAVAVVVEMAAVAVAVMLDSASDDQPILQ